jgi:hypothetical protein
MQASKRTSASGLKQAPSRLPTREWRVSAYRAIRHGIGEWPQSPHIPPLNGPSAMAANHPVAGIRPPTFILQQRLFVHV